MIATIGYRLAVAASIALLAAAPPAHTQSLDDFYAKAKNEGRRVLRRRPHRAVGSPCRNLWSAFPGIKVTIGGGFSNVLDKKVDAQLAAGKLEVDAVIFQTAGDFGRWKTEGRLLAFKPNGFDKMDAAFKDADGTFWATMVNVVPYMYNTEKVAAADIPNAATDFLKPQFRGKAVTCYPADDDATLFLFYTLSEKYGWPYVERYMATEPAFVQGHLGVLQWIAAGRRALTFDCSTHTGTDMKAAGQPIEVVFSASDPTPIFYNTAGILGLRRIRTPRSCS